MANAEQIAQRKKVLAQIESNPQEFDMQEWAWKSTEGPSETSCKTTYCIAGRVAVENGWKFQAFTKVFYQKGGFSAPNIVVKDGVEKGVVGLAAELLGLPWEEADQLFTTETNERALEILRAYAEEDPS